MTQSTPISCKGFLRQTNEGIWVLSKRPDVKSCCLLKQEDTAILIGDFKKYPQKRAVKVTGTIVKADPLTLDQVTFNNPSTLPYIIPAFIVGYLLLRRFVKRLLPLP